MSQLITVGETMALLTTARRGRLRHADALTLGVAGAESNVAVGVSRLGGRAAWIGRVGDDELGELILSTLRGEGVDVSGGRRDDAANTSLMIKERLTTNITRISYYRKDGPGARLQPSDLDEQAIRDAKVLHLTGITPALSLSARETVHHSVEVARAARTIISLDYNYRAALWDATSAAAELRDLTASADIVFASEDEARLVTGADEVTEHTAALAALGAQSVLIKRGELGAIAAIRGRLLNIDAFPVNVVDPVGAGDAFVAGYLADVLAGHDDEECLQTAAACGAFAVTTTGDWEGMPNRKDLGMLHRTSGTVLR